MSNNSNKISKYIILTAILAVVIIFLYGYFINKPKFDKYGVYTIGTIIKIEAKAKSWPRVTYKYTFKSKEYIDSFLVNTEIWNYKENDRILIRTTSVDPNLSTVEDIIRIPDSIKEAPSEGWKELPDWAEKKFSPHKD
jgi:hypothetical protein